MPRVVMVIAVRFRDSMMCIRLVILELIGVVPSKCRVEILLLVWPGIMLANAIDSLKIACAYSLLNRR
jgi:hypothetical protein